MVSTYTYTYVLNILTNYFRRLLKIISRRMNLARKLRMRIILRVISRPEVRHLDIGSVFPLFLLDEIVYRVPISIESVACDVGNIIVTC